MTWQAELNIWSLVETECQGKRAGLHGPAQLPRDQVLLLTERKEVPRPWSWRSLGKKQYRIQTVSGNSVKLNQFRPRMNIEFLRNLCWKYGPVHLYMSALEFLIPDRIGEKRVANHALTIRGEHIVDVDAMNVWQHHSHYIGPEGVCYGCLEASRANN